jgi:hypothetical protein
VAGTGRGRVPARGEPSLNVAAAFAAAIATSLPQHGTLAPGHALGGVRLGEPAAEVRAALGSFYGVCRGCATTTWYFTYRPFDDHGLGVELTRGRVSAVYTLWQPTGWSAPHGLRLGAPEAQVTKLAGPLIPVTCTGYTALYRDAGSTRTVYIVVNGSLWGFGLFPTSGSPCR